MKSHGLESQLQREEELDQIRQAFEKGVITKTEHDVILAHDYGVTAEEKTSRWPIITAALVIIGVFGLFAAWGGTITGFAVYPTEDTLIGGVFTNNSVLSLNVTNTTMVKLTGTLENGSATIYAQSGENTWLVWTGETGGEAVWLENARYTPNQNISVVTELENYTLWVTDVDGNKTPVSDPFTLETGDYTLSVLTNATKEDIDFSVGNESVARIRSVALTQACEETCELPGANNVSLIITVSLGARLELTEIIVTQPVENSAPQQVAEIPTLAVNGSATLNLAPYFVDAEDEITFEINNIVGLDESIDGSELTVSGNIPGTYGATVYVSDGKALTTAEFTIIVVGVAQTNETQTNTTNETTNETTTNETTNETQSEAQTLPTNDQLGCDHPNINKRPPECFQEQFDLAFESIDAPLKNQGQVTVGRFTRLGNLVISGQVIENSASNPAAGDFKIGQTVTTGFIDTFQAAAWINSGTGDLHLRGNLYQEVIDVDAPQYNSYTVSNSNGIVLGYFDERTGDLYLKGNIVQLGKP